MSTQQQRGTVTSRDGTSIGYRTQGAGPPLVISPGSVNLIQNWQRTTDEVSGTFTCFLYDRRGHGSSGDRPEYSLAAEIADLQAMLDVAGAGARVLAHSYSGLVALQHAVTHGVDTQLILYEPPLDLKGQIGREKLDGFRTAVAAGDVDGAIRFALREMAGVPDQEIAALSHSPAWPSVCELAPKWLRELELLDDFAVDVERYRQLPQEKLHFLAGEQSHATVRETIRRFGELLPAAEVTTMPGLGHFAHTTDPPELARHVMHAAGLRKRGDRSQRQGS